jgi:hypothetical protein
MMEKPDEDLDAACLSCDDRSAWSGSGLAQVCARCWLGLHASSASLALLAVAAMAADDEEDDNDDGFDPGTGQVLGSDQDSDEYCTDCTSVLDGDMCPVCDAACGECNSTLLGGTSCPVCD